MSDSLVGEIFASVALPMCLLILAFLFSDYIRKRDEARRALDEAADQFAAAHGNRVAA